MAARTQDYKNGRVILFTGFGSETEKDITDERNVVEILPVKEMNRDRIVAGTYVLPVSDAKIVSSPEGLVYCYNVSLPYLSEISHLAEVEKNIVVGQAYLYQGKNLPTGKPNLFQWVCVIFVFLLGALAIFSK